MLFWAPKRGSEWKQLGVSREAQVPLALVSGDTVKADILKLNNTSVLNLKCLFFAILKSIR